MKEGKQALASGFATIGADEVDEEGNPIEGIYLTEMIPTTDKCNGDIIVEILDEYGVAKEMQVYSYYKNSFGNDDGWWNDDDEQVGEDIDDVFFPAGSGIWVTGVDGDGWNTAGQVYDADKEITLGDGKQVLANPYATGLSLANNIWVDCDKCNGDVIIEILDMYGVAKNLQVYSFYYNSFGNDDGWWNDDDEQVGEDIDDVVFQPGEGIFVTGVDGYKFQITSPLK